MNRIRRVENFDRYEILAHPLPSREDRVFHPGDTETSRASITYASHDVRIARPTGIGSKGRVAILMHHGGGRHVLEFNETALPIATALLAVTPASAKSGVKVGSLNCTVAGGVGLILGSSKSMKCRFSPAGGGRVERYTGSITKLGVDIGFTKKSYITWAVFAGGKTKAGALAGSLPLVILYAFFVEHYVSAMTGAVKE